MSKGNAWDQVKKRVRKECPEVSVIEIEHSDMDNLPKKHQVRAFPILRFYPHGSEKAGVEYNGLDRAPDSILSFVHRVHILPNGHSAMSSKTKKSSITKTPK